MRSIRDILGPVMIGPSSSHTAGACRIGKIARVIIGEDILSVRCNFHGSFGKTYRGHGTDRAVIAGILGMEPDDERLVESISIAKKMGIEVLFIEKELGSNYHPNTVLIEMESRNGKKLSLIGSSIGGGNVEIVNIDGRKVFFTGKYNTLLVNHIDKPGVVHEITKILSEEDINIAYLEVFRDNRGDNASMVFQLDEGVSCEIINKIKKMDSIFDCVFINSIN